MSLEILAAGELLAMASGGIVGNAASDGIRFLCGQLWQKITSRLVKNNPTLEAEIVELEENPTSENLKLLEDFLKVEMHKDKLFANEISKLGKEIAKSNGGDTIEISNFEAKDNAVVVGKIDAPNSRIGGSDTNINVGKN